MSSDLMDVNSQGVIIPIDETSRNAVMTFSNQGGNYIIFYNDSTNPVYVVTGRNPALSVVFPTSGSFIGKVVGAKETISYKTGIENMVVYAIQAVAGVGNLFVYYGQGE